MSRVSWPRHGARTGRETPSRRKRIAWWGGVVLSAAVLLTVAALYPRPAARPGGSDLLRFGVLGSSCDAARVAALPAAGIDLVELQVDWTRFEPEQGVVSQDYVSVLRDQLERCRTAGLRVVLSPGVQYPPPWVLSEPGTTYVNQHGDHGPDRVLNLIFSDAARRAAQQYVSKLLATIHPDEVTAIRVGTSENGELGYPTPPYGSDTGNAFWAFDRAAQSGDGLADGATVSPLPGWHPGSRTWHGHEVTTEQVRSWFRWYSHSAVQAVVWEIQTFRRYGYRGDIHVPLAGRGVLPDDLRQAVAADLDGTGARDGSLGRGLYYPEQLPYLASATKGGGRGVSGAVLADATGLDDATAVAARHLHPRQDMCRPGDAAADLLADPGVVDWSTSRWTVANARRAGLDVIGENPGSPHAPNTGGDSGSDELWQQAYWAPRYAVSCGMSVMMWAFEDDLFGDPETMTLEALAQQIQAVRKRAP